MEITKLIKLLTLLFNVKEEIRKIEPEIFEEMADPDCRWDFICWSQLETNINKAHDIVHNEIKMRSQFKKESD